MDFVVLADDTFHGQYQVLFNQILVGIMHYHHLTMTGWYEDEDRGHFTVMFDVEYDQMVNHVRKLYE